jgi:hypothetical protein
MTVARNCCLIKTDARLSKSCQRYSHYGSAVALMSPPTNKATSICI